MHSHVQWWSVVDAKRKQSQQHIKTQAVDNTARARARTRRPSLRVSSTTKRCDAGSVSRNADHALCGVHRPMRTPVSGNRQRSIWPAGGCAPAPLLLGRAAPAAPECGMARAHCVRRRAHSAAAAIQLRTASAAPLRLCERRQAHLFLP